ncbi:MAG: hypothetical protein NZ992_06425 [Candidatus Korarchaeum sp.]|nr:hypothetical protein [Candidatus Korarchaeum sp.]MDW8035922.1 hypothetical protein [Candidatus Korarchaeum sp.]
MTERYGLAIIIGNVVQMLSISTLWFWEAIIRRNDFTSPRLSLSNLWTILLAFLTFWYPLDPESAEPDFNVSYLLMNSAGLAFCMMTPFYLTLLVMNYPKVNRVTMRIISLVGTIIGFWNMVWTSSLCRTSGGTGCSTSP